MSPRRTLALLALLTLAAASRAHAVCTAADIAASEAGCAPGNATCSIAKSYPIDNGCTLDFGTQTLVVGSKAHLTIGSGTVTIRAAAVTIFGLIDGVGSANNASGGMVMIETSGNVAVPQHGSINVQGNRGGGDVVVRAGGSVSIDGKVQADFLKADAAGGLIDISAGGDITAGTTSTLSAQGGSTSDGGGEIDLTAGGALTLQSDLDVDGFCGGILELQAGGRVTMQGADASGDGDAGSGGCVDVTAGANAVVLGTITVDGVSGSFMIGGCGGLICLDGGLGDVTVQAGALISADGASPDGGGGNITLMARGNAVINGAITARGPTGETCGGEVCVETGLDVTLAPTGRLDLSGGCDGGELELDAGRNMTLNGPTDVSGTAGGSLGGDVTAHAGLRGSGSLVLSSSIDVSSAASCSIANGCGEGGTTDLGGCNLTITSGGAVLASGPDAGENDLTGRAQVTVQGTLNAANTVPTGAVGTNYVVYPAGTAPIVQGNGITPALSAVSLATCSEKGQTTPPCLMPCPVCGNGLIEFPETCDRGIIPPESCSDCSVYCQIEHCDDGLVCTGDSCSRTYGCINQPTPNCIEPTATVTATRTASATRTATSTPTASPTDTATPTPTDTPTASPTATGTATDTASATQTATSTPTASPSGTATATPTNTVTTPPTATATVTQTPSPDPTATPPPACAGDCDGNGMVTVNELIVGVDIALGVTDSGACPAFDRDRNGAVSISELIAAVNTALNGC